MAGWLIMIITNILLRMTMLEFSVMGKSAVGIYFD